MNDDDGRQPWDRRAGESARCYATFRRFRDLGPLRTFDDLVSSRLARSTVAGWAARHGWRDRAEAWDAELHRAEDLARLEMIRDMHRDHVTIGRGVRDKAWAAIDALDPGQLDPAVAARLLALGAQLVRDTLTVSVEALQGVEHVADDPWEAVARELDSLPS